MDGEIARVDEDLPRDDVVAVRVAVGIGPQPDEREAPYREEGDDEHEDGERRVALVQAHRAVV